MPSLGHPLEVDFLDDILLKILAPESDVGAEDVEIRPPRRQLEKLSLICRDAVGGRGRHLDERVLLFKGTDDDRYGFFVECRRYAQLAFLLRAFQDLCSGEGYPFLLGLAKSLRSRVRP